MAGTSAGELEDAVRAWRLAAPGGPFDLRTVPLPATRAGAVLVRLRASPLLSYLRAYVAGGLTSYHPPAGEFTPGTNGVGVIEQVGADVYGLAPGQRVFLSPHLVATENVAEPAEALVGLTAEPASAALLDTWRDGTLAEYTLAPASAVTPVPAALDDVDSVTLAALSRCTVPYGGLVRGRLAAGESLVIHGATGAFGSAGVLVALALGASRIVAAGRNEAALARLAELPRVHPVRMTGDVDADAGALREAAGEGAHCALDLIGRADSAAGTLAALASLRRGGRLVLMGSMTVPLALDYAALLRSGKEVLGTFMYPREAPARLLALAAGRQLRLDDLPVETFPLAELPAAMKRAEQPAAPLVVMT